MPGGVAVGDFDGVFDSVAWPKSLNGGHAEVDPAARFVAAGRGVRVGRLDRVKGYFAFLGGFFKNT